MSRGGGRFRIISTPGSKDILIWLLTWELILMYAKTDYWPFSVEVYAGQTTSKEWILGHFLEVGFSWVLSVNLVHLGTSQRPSSYADIWVGRNNSNLSCGGNLGYLLPARMIDFSSLLGLGDASTCTSPNLSFKVNCDKVSTKDLTTSDLQLLRTRKWSWRENENDDAHLLRTWNKEHALILNKTC